jgi:hypothetical protein
MTFFSASVHIMFPVAIMALVNPPLSPPPKTPCSDAVEPLDDSMMLEELPKQMQNKVLLLVHLVTCCAEATRILLSFRHWVMKMKHGFKCTQKL